MWQTGRKWWSQTGCKQPEEVPSFHFFPSTGRPPICAFNPHLLATPIFLLFYHHCPAPKLPFSSSHAFSPQSSAGFLQPPSLFSLSPPLSPFFSSYLWKRHFKSLPVWISLVSCVFLPVNNPESRLSLFPSLSICQSAPPLNWKPLRPTSTHSIRAARLLLRLPFSAKIPFFFSFVPTARALENANRRPPKLKLGLFQITEIKGLKLRVLPPLSEQFLLGKNAATQRRWRGRSGCKRWNDFLQRRRGAGRENFGELLGRKGFSRCQIFACKRVGNESKQLVGFRGKLHIKIGDRSSPALLKLGAYICATDKTWKESLPSPSSC